jgi:hypothetical protein
MPVIAWLPRLLSGAIAAGLVAVAVSGAPALAQQPSQPPGTSATTPDQLLQKFPSAGVPLSNAVQDMAITNPSTFDALLALVANATDEQKSAIGAGLAQATKIEVLTNQALATEWQQKIAAITDRSFEIAATNAFGDIQLGATGSAAGAAGSGLGGPGNGPGGTGSSGPPETIGSNPISTQTFTLTSSISGGALANTLVSP